MKPREPPQAESLTNTIIIHKSECCVIAMIANIHRLSAVATESAALAFAIGRSTPVTGRPMLNINSLGMAVPYRQMHGL